MNIGIAGLGVIGGSIGLGLLKAGRIRRVVGFDMDATAGREAATAGCVTELAETAADLGGMDAVFVAVPPQSVRSTLESLEGSKGEDTVVTDCASTKGKIAEWVASKESRAEWFVGGHPMAGNEGSGPQFARQDLFDGAAWVLTPFGEEPSRSLATVAELVESLGAWPVRMTAQSHDKHVAVLSHIPHALAAALIAAASGLDNPGIAGGSWRDLTRVAGSNPALWQSIFLQNRDAILSAMQAFDTAMGEVRAALEHNDGDALRAFFEEARQSKRRQGGRP